jgi:3-deoxy-D-manno-octulosonate 8-phosphate phosphatase KdsC-like HAD superfamily phosphatase
MPTRCWVFDVDGCVVDSLLGASLRPFARELLTHLRSVGCDVIWWSAGGHEHARLRAQRFGVDHLVTEFADKDGRDVDRRYLTDHLGIVLAEVVFVDDHPEDLPVGAEVVAVPPYLIENPRDRGLVPAALRAGLELEETVEERARWS